LSVEFSIAGRQRLRMAEEVMRRCGRFGRLHRQMPELNNVLPLAEMSARTERREARDRNLGL
jgi:hypothetical protein